jgi:hypothetical protein
MFVFHVCYGVFVLSSVLNALRSCTCCMEIFLRFISSIISQSINQSISNPISLDLKEITCGRRGEYNKALDTKKVVKVRLSNWLANFMF